MRTLPALLLIVFATSTAKAQVMAMPRSLQDFLSEIGSVWANDTQGNIRRTSEAYTLILRDAPTCYKGSRTN